MKYTKNTVSRKTRRDTSLHRHLDARRKVRHNYRRIFGGWQLASRVSKEESQTKFDALVNSFEFYLEPELGRRAAFFTDTTALR
jgi:hypothetical protein